MRCPSCYRRLATGRRCEQHPLAPDTLAPPPAEEHLDPPRLDGYAVEGLLGYGGFATVFAARASDGRAVAIKRARSGADPRFTVEALALWRVGRAAAPELLACADDERGRPMLVLERLTGVTLADWLAAQPRATPPFAEAVAIARALCAAVATVHAVGVVHRDLKPENVFWCDGVVRLVDFGIARVDGRGVEAAAAGQTLTGAQLGTVTYMAPEQCRGDAAIGAAADVYALGVLLFELLTGRPPFVGDASEVAQAHVARRPPRPSAYAPLPDAVDEIVSRCLAKEPRERFSGAAELARALDDALAVNAPPTATAPAAAPSPPSGARRQAVALLAVELAGDGAALPRSAVPAGAQLARVSAGRNVLVFTDDAPAVGVRRAAQTVATLGATVRRAVVHVAELRLRAGGNGVSGAAVDRVDGWWPRDAAEPLLLTDDAARRVEPGATRAAATAGCFILCDALPTGDVVETLHGREHDLALLLADADAALGERAPRLTTLVGDIGVGKSRLLAALTPALAARGFAVVSLIAPAPEERRGSLLRALVVAAFELGDEPTRDDVDRACAERLGDGAGERAAAAIALMTGSADEAVDGAGARALAVDAAARALAWRAARRPLALLVDGAERADAASLDLVERAAASSAAPLWSCVAARPALVERRPQWAERAARHRLHRLTPLAADAAARLVRERLRPAEFVPQAIVDRVVEASERVPLHLVELGRLLHAAGAIRRHASGHAFYVAADALLHVRGASVGERLATAALATLTPELVAAVRACAVLGDSFSAQALRRLSQTLERTAPEHALQLDIGVTLDRLQRHGFVEPTDDGYRFRHPLVRAHIEEQMPAATRRRLHQAALEGLTRDDSYAGLSACARHAAAAGDAAQAVAAHLRIADRARRQHRFVDADEHYTAALHWLDSGDAALQARALGGRGRSRYRLDRYADALDDLRAARARTPATETASVAELLFEEATVLDWMGRFADAAEIAEQAAPWVARSDDAALRARLALARGRALCRAERFAEAVALLEAALAAGRATHDHETQVIAGMLLAVALQSCGRSDDAERALTDVIARCERAGDHAHLAGAYINRQSLWLPRGDHERSVADCRRASELAQALGNSRLERVALTCLAHVLLWQGALDAALVPARRARELALRFQEQQSVFEPLILARVQAARGELAEAGALVAWIDAHCPPSEIIPSLRPLIAAVRLVVDGDGAGAGWRALLTTLPRELLLTDELLELLWLHARAAAAAGRIDEALASLDEALAAGSAAWAPRLQAVAARCGAAAVSPARARHAAPVPRVAP